MAKKTYRFDMLQWLIIPALLIWFSASYLLGVATQPVWQEHDSQKKTTQVLASSTETITVPDTAQYTWEQTGLVTFWFDDGWLTQYTVAAPVLKQHDYSAAISITTDVIGYDAYMSWGQVKRLFHVYNWEITAHSRTHTCEQDTFTPEILNREIVGSLQDLVAQGIRPDTYVVPCGKMTPELIQMVKDNYVAMRDATGGFNPLPLADPYTIHAFTIHDNVSLTEIQGWLDQAQQDKLWLILMFHQLDTQSGEYSLNPQSFTQIVDAVAHSGLPVVLPTQVLGIISQ